ncbi:DUF5979 domain-containing protein [Alloscardovia venturai]|uniref:DUF5979 domain-containing protein n=1 Tax=Alloscardovia venturai TaxID=1769421 RepID=A0ABW2Y883_9BIFI
MKRYWRGLLAFCVALVTIVATLFAIPPVKAEDVAPTTTLKKTITKIAGTDDQYELALSLLPKNGSAIQTVPMDVVFVADMSTSMEDNMSTGISRIEGLKRALVGYGGQDGFLKTVLSNPDNRVSFVSFGGLDDDHDYWQGGFARDAYDDSWTSLQWTGNLNTANTAARNLELAKDYCGSGYCGGTNIGAGIRSAGELLHSGRSNAKKVIVLLTDGEATHFYDERGYTLKDGDYTSGSAFQHDLRSALRRDLAQVGSIDGFYSIDYGTSAQSTLNTIHSLVQSTGVANSDAQGIFSANNEHELADSFKKIADKISSLALRQVSITDILSKYVELPNGAFDIRMTKTDASGNVTELNSNQVTFSRTANAQGKVEVVAKFADDYVLEDGASYEVRFKVQASQAAFDEIADNPHVTELHSNEDAYITYRYGTGTDVSNPVTKHYDDNPVFTPSKIDGIPVTVEWHAIHQSDIPDSIDVNLHQDGKDASYRSLTIQKGTNQGTFGSAAKGHTYSITSTDVDGFTKTIENVGTDQNPSYKIVYRQLPKLTVAKKVSGDLADKSKEFTLHVSAKSQDGSPLNGEYDATVQQENSDTLTHQKVTFTNGTTDVKLKHGQSITIDRMPLNATYSVTEDQASAKGYTATYENQTGTLSTDMTVTVTNTLPYVPQTATHTDTNSTTQLTVGVILAGAILLLSGLGVGLGKASKRS